MSVLTDWEASVFIGVWSMKIQMTMIGLLFLLNWAFFQLHNNLMMESTF